MQRAKAKLAIPRKIIHTIQQLAKQNESQAIKITLAVFDYLDNIEPQLDTIELFFSIVKPELDEQLSKRETAYKNGVKGGSYGVKGGRPRLSPAPAPKNKQEKQDTTPTPTPRIKKQLNKQEDLILSQEDISQEQWLLINNELNIKTDIFLDFVKTRINLKKTLTSTSLKSILSTLGGYELKGKGIALQSITNSIANHWQGCFLPKENHSTSISTSTSTIKNKSSGGFFSDFFKKNNQQTQEAEAIDITSDSFSITNKIKGGKCKTD
jgi:hypothetical protein